MNKPAASGLEQFQGDLAHMKAVKQAAKTVTRRPEPAHRLFDDFLPHLIARLAHELNVNLINELRKEGINATRWRILAVLAMGDGITINEIIDRAMMQQSALSRALMSMEEENYVRRVPRPGDARYVQVFLTETGRALFNTLNVVVERRQKQLLKGFSASESQAAFVLIRRLIRNMTG